MFDFVVIFAAIYLALVAACITVMAVMCSKWFLKKYAKMTMRLLEGFVEESGDQKEEA